MNLPTLFFLQQELVTRKFARRNIQFILFLYFINDQGHEILGTFAVKETNNIKDVSPAQRFT
jgi:hypothetical protein